MTGGVLVNFHSLVIIPTFSFTEKTVGFGQETDITAIKKLGIESYRL